MIWQYKQIPQPLVYIISKKLWNEAQVEKKKKGRAKVEVSKEEHILFIIKHVDDLVPTTCRK
jgi:hypothetical protein